MMSESEERAKSGKAAKTYMGFTLPMGVAIGAGIGAALGNVAVGVAIGAAVGVGLGGLSTVVLNKRR